MRHFNSFSGTQLIFSRAGPSVAFLWVPFLFPQKEMEHFKNRVYFHIKTFKNRV
jgi:hypothetical protein